MFVFACVFPVSQVRVSFDAIAADIEAIERTLGNLITPDLTAVLRHPAPVDTDVAGTLDNSEQFAALTIRVTPLLRVINSSLRQVCTDLSMI